MIPNQIRLTVVRFVILYLICDYFNTKSEIIDDELLHKLARMEAQQRETMALLKQMKPKLDHLSRESGFGQDIPHFPIKTDQELLAIERKMEESEDYQKAVVRFRSLLDYVKQLLYRLII